MARLAPTQIGTLLGQLPSPRKTLQASSQPALSQSFPPLPSLPSEGSNSLPSHQADSLGPLLSRPIAPGKTVLKAGAYLAVFRSRHPDVVAWPMAVGILRWEQIDLDQVVVSGDLYTSRSPFLTDAEVERALAGGPRATSSGDDVESIPCFPRDRYHAYLRFGRTEHAYFQGVNPANAGSPGPESTHPKWIGSVHRIRNVPTNSWHPGVPVYFQTDSTTPDPNHPFGLCTRARFSLIDATGLLLGELHARWISPYFRDAVVEIDTEPGLPAPVDNGAEESWATVFGRVGWNVRVETGRLASPTPPSGRWTYAELHDAMLESRSGNDLDAEWRYHVSVVTSFADNPAPIAIAFDHEGMDLNGVPREGVAIYGGAGLPNLPIYGRYAGRSITEFPELLFKIALHEVGHAMGLHHNHLGFGIMDQVDDLAEHSPSGHLDARSLEPRFAPDDILRLRHLPDIHVRPGGTDFETEDLAEDHDEAAHLHSFHIGTSAHETSDRHHDPSLSLELRIPTTSLPTGTPVRVDLILTNRTPSPVPAPPRLSLSTPYVHGQVVGPDGVPNPFSSFFTPVDPIVFHDLEPGGWIQGSLTLLRGRLGALTARPGHHTVWIEVSWSWRGKTWSARQSARFEALAAQSPEEARATRRLVQTPETLPFLILGSTRSSRAGQRAIDAAVDVAALRPHFTFIKARADSSTTRESRIDWASISRLLADPKHMDLLNRREREKACTLRAIAEMIGIEGNPIPHVAS